MYDERGLGDWGVGDGGTLLFWGLFFLYTLNVLLLFGSDANKLLNDMNVCVVHVPPNKKKNV